MTKLSLQTLMPAKDLAAMFHFVEVRPYEKTDFFGLSIEPHYTVHSIPTIGATFRMKDGNTSRSIVFIGDNKSFEDIEKMVTSSIVRQEKYDNLRQKYTERHDIISGTTDSYLIRTMNILNASFRNISPEWGTALMNNFRIVTFNSGDIIFKQNEPSKGFIFIILTGSCSVMYHDGRILSEKARKEAGDFVGEMAVLDENKVRSASIVAATPVTLCAIDDNLFHQFLIAENRVEEMRALWKNRSEIEKFHPFMNFADNVNDRIARSAVRMRVAAGDTLVEQGKNDGEFFIILSGEYSVRHNGVEIKVLRGGDMFGEYGSLAETARNATVTALTDGVVLEVARGEIRKIIESATIFQFSMREIMMRRSRELRQLERSAN